MKKGGGKGKEEKHLAYFDAQTLNIVEVIEQAFRVSTESELIGEPVVLKDGSVGVVVGWVPIEISIDREDVKRETPVPGRGMIAVVGPFPPVISWVYRTFVLIKVIANMIRTPSQCLDG
jgi:hypothetical protein